MCVGERPQILKSSVREKKKVASLGLRPELRIGEFEQKGEKISGKLCDSKGAFRLGYSHGPIKVERVRDRLRRVCDAYREKALFPEVLRREKAVCGGEQ